MLKRGTYQMLCCHHEFRSTLARGKVALTTNRMKTRVIFLKNTKRVNITLHEQLAKPSEVNWRSNSLNVQALCVAINRISSVRINLLLILAAALMAFIKMMKFNAEKVL